MATTKQQRRYNGLKNVVAAQRRNSKTTATVPAATEQEQQEVLVKLDASPVNGAPAAPAAPQAPAEPAAPAEVPVVPEDPKAAAEAPKAAETPETPEAPETPAVPEFTIEQELAFIAAGLKTLLGVKSDVPLTPEGLATLGLRTARQALMGVIADEKSLLAIQAKKDEWVNKAKALIPSAENADEPTLPVREEPRIVGEGFQSRWLPTGVIAREVRIHSDDKLVGVAGDGGDYRWYKINGKLVWDYK